jgi:hypothetical protein
MKGLTQLQTKVLNLAQSKIEDKYWFRELCLDPLMDDSEIERLGTDRCSEILIFSTEFRDNPNFYNVVTKRS